MARSRRTRASRAFIVLVVSSIAAGAAFQVHHMRQASAKPALTNNDKPATLLLADTSVSTKPQLPSVLKTDPTTQPGSQLTPAIWKQENEAKFHAAQLASEQATTRPAQLASQVVPPGRLIDEAKTKLNNGDILAARKQLNDTLLAGNLSPTDAAAIKQQIADINKTVVFSTQHFANDPYGGVYTVKPGQRLAAIATQCEIPWQLLLKLNNMSDPRKLRANQSLKVIKGPFHVVVSKSAFMMDIYLGSPGEAGSMYVSSFRVGLGTDNSTPTGTWMIKDKVTHPVYYSPRGEGVIAAGDPKNPLGPVWLGLTGTDGQAVGKASYGIHGTIDPDSIGKMSSMGCVRMHNEDVAVVYDLLVEGKSTVQIKD